MSKHIEVTVKGGATCLGVLKWLMTTGVKANDTIISEFKADSVLRVLG